MSQININRSMLIQFVVLIDPTAFEIKFNPPELPTKRVLEWVATAAATAASEITESLKVMASQGKSALKQFPP